MSKLHTLRLRKLSTLLDEAEWQGCDTSRSRGGLDVYDAAQLALQITHWEQTLRLNNEMDRFFNLGSGT